MKILKRKWPSLSLGTIVLGMMATQSGATVVNCEYDSNEEWPQPVGKVCQVQEPSIGAAKDGSGLLLSDDSGAAASGYPDCTSAVFDSDGDGWGWENNASCRVVTVSGYPACANSNSDPDGDGWGWENNASCKVSVTTTENPYPDCEYRASDDNNDGWGYEKGQSCRVTSSSAYPVCSASLTDTDNDGWGYENNSSCQFRKVKVYTGVVFEQDFESTAVGSYGSDQLNADWDTPLWHLGFVQGRVDVVADTERGNALRVTYPANEFGSSGAAAFLSDVKFGVDLPASYEELYVSYDVKFAEGFDFVRGGKLPGLCGYDNTESPVSGCNTGGGFPDGYDGWSARGMWRENGKLENYVYHAGQTNYYGDDEYWSVDAQPGKWHRVQHRVVLNTPGVANGILEAWLDGQKVLSDDTFMFRKTADIGINLFYFSTFYGGNDASWAPTEDQFVFFDNFRISTDSSEEPVIGQAVALNNLPLNDDAVNVESGGKSGGGVVNPLLLLLLMLPVVVAGGRLKARSDAAS